MTQHIVNSLAYLAIIDSALGAAGCTPDGYVNLSAAESALVAAGEREKVDPLAIAEQLVLLRREGQLFNMLRASVQIAALRREHEAVVADLEGLRELVRGLSLQRVA